MGSWAWRALKAREDAAATRCGRGRGADAGSGAPEFASLSSTAAALPGECGTPARPTRRLHGHHAARARRIERAAARRAHWRPSAAAGGPPSDESRTIKTYSIRRRRRVGGGLTSKDVHAPRSDGRGRGREREGWLLAIAGDRDGTPHRPRRPRSASCRPPSPRLPPPPPPPPGKRRSAKGRFGAGARRGVSGPPRARRVRRRRATAHWGKSPGAAAESAGPQGQDPPLAPARLAARGQEAARHPRRARPARRQLCDQRGHNPPTRRSLLSR
jgi:hypothetical protein